MHSTWETTHGMESSRTTGLRNYGATELPDYRIHGLRKLVMEPPLLSSSNDGGSVLSQNGFRTASESKVCPGFRSSDHKVLQPSSSALCKIMASQNDTW